MGDDFRATLGSVAVEAPPVRKCIVTGGSGFVGIALVRRLLAEGCAVTVYDLGDPNAPDIKNDIVFVRGDVRDRDGLRTAARAADAFFHIAAMVPLTRAGKGFWEVNVGGVENAVDAALSAGVGHFVHLSSSAIYGIPATLPVTESTAPTPLGEYGRSKLAGERAAQKARDRGLKVAVIRPRTVVGPGRLGIFDLLFEWIRGGRPIFMLGSGNKPFQLLSNRDLAEAMLLANRTQADGEFNVGTDRFTTLRQDLNHLAEAVASRSRMVSIPSWLARPGLQALDWLRLSPLVDWHYKTIDKEFWFDIQRAQQILGWQPRDSNFEMLSQAFQWYVENRSAGELSQGSTHRAPISRGLFRVLSKGTK